MNYPQDYEKAIKYAANSEWKGFLAKIHEQPENRHTYGVLADWLDENGHEDLAHFFRKHGYDPKHKPEWDGHENRTAGALTLGFQNQPHQSLIHYRGPFWVRNSHIGNIDNHLNDNPSYHAVIPTHPDKGHLSLWGINDAAADSLRQLEDI